MSRRTASNCADQIRKHMDQKNLNLMTMEWGDFYTFVGRKVVRGSFTEDLQAEMRSRQMLYSEGSTCAVFVRDYNSSPADRDFVNS